MSEDFNVKFGSDTRALTQGLAEARQTIAALGAAIAPLTEAVAKLNVQMDESNRATAGYLAKARDATIVIGGITYAVKEAAVGFATLAGGLEQAGVAAVRFTAFGIGEIIAGAAAGIRATAAEIDTFIASGDHAERSARLMAQTIDYDRTVLGRFANGMQEAAAASDSLGLAVSAGVVSVLERSREAYLGVTTAMQAYLAGVALIKQGSVDAELATIASAGGFDKFAAAVAASGDKFGPVTETLDHFTRELAQIDGMTRSVADSIEATIVSIPNYSVASNETIVNFLQQTSKTAEEAQQKVKALADAFKSDMGGAALAEGLLGKIDFKDVDTVQGKLEDLLTTAKALARNFADPAQAKAFYDTLMAKTDQYNRSAQQGFNEQVAALEKMGGFARALLLPLQEQAQKQGEINVAIAHTIGLMQIQSRASNDILANLKEEQKLHDALNSGKSPSDTLTDLQEQVRVLKQGVAIRKAQDVDDISDADKELAIKTAILEAGNQSNTGVIAVLNTMYNRLNASYGNYGDSLAAVIQKKSAYSGVDDASGAFDKSKVDSISTQSYQYQRVLDLWAQSRFGDNPIDDPSKGATHYYNPALASPPWASGMVNINPIGAHVFGNPDGRPVPSSEDAAKAREMIEQSNDAIRQQTALKQGGTAADQAGLDILRQQATATQDDVAAAQKKLDAARQQVVATGQIVTQENRVTADESKPLAATPTAQREAATAYYQALDGLRKADVAKEVAAIDVKLAATQKGTREELDLTIEKARAQQSLYAKDSAQYLGFEREIATAQKQYQTQQTADAVSQEDIRYEAAKRALAEKTDLIKEAARTGQMSGIEETRALQAQLVAQLDLEKAHWAARGQLQSANVQQYREDMQKLQLATQQSLQAMLAQQRAFGQQVYQTYLSAFQQVNSAVSSSLMAIIQRTGTWRDFMRNSVLAVVQYFIDAGLKIIAEWAAVQAKQITLTMLGEDGKTTAVAAGEAQRAAAVHAGVVEQMAVQTFGVVKSILASAAETFAGIFGFLSPVMGPAAAGPAAAGQAAVAGVAGSVARFDVGTWSLPRDMVAQVHAGEMIVPAAQTPWMQSLAAAAAGGGAAGGGGGQPINFTIQALDAPSVVALFRNNGRALAGVVQDTIRRNPSLG